MRVAYFGYHGEASGYGVATGLHARALQRAGVNVEKLRAEAPLAGRLVEADVAVVQVPVDRLPSALPVAREVAPRVVLFSVWETATLPGGWEQGAGRADALWVPSRLAAQAFGGVSRPLAVVPHPVAVRSPRRRRFARIRDTDTVFFAALEWQARKNPRGLLRAFTRAFARRDDVVLVLKVGFLIEHDPARIINEIRNIAGKDSPRVVVLVDTLSRLTLLRVMARADAVISLHRAEGFGLVLAEAAARGVPAVCAATGGPLDFLEPDGAYLVPGEMRAIGNLQGYPFEPAMRWLEPDLDAAVEALRACASDPAGRQRRGRRAQEIVRERLAPERIGASMRGLLEG